MEASYLTVCARCNNAIPRLKLNQSQTVLLFNSLTNKSGVHVVKWLMDFLGYNHRDSKVIMDHLNYRANVCKRCTGRINGTNVECPTCNAFNYNLKPPIFNAEFCTHLEYVIAFNRSELPEISGFWCDGILHIPDDLNQLNKVNLAYNKTIVTKAWMGKTGQDEYEVTIRLGEKAVKAYLNDERLIDTIPITDCQEWVEIDVENQTAVVQLS